MIASPLQAALALSSARVVIQPTVEPVSLALARSHLRLWLRQPDDAHPDDEWLTTVGIPAAREYCEGYMERSIGQQQIELTMGAFPAATVSGSSSISLPFGPVRSLDSILYRGTDGIDAQISDAMVSRLGRRAILYPPAMGVWPAAAGSMEAIRIRYSAGYTLPADDPNDQPLPRVILAAMLLMLGHLYEQRNASTEGRQGIVTEMPLGVAALLEPHVLRLSLG